MPTQTIDMNDVTSCTFNNQSVNEIYLNSDKIWPPSSSAFITFSSPNTFGLSIANGGNLGKTWDGTIEYSYDKDTWWEWTGGATTLSGSRVGDYVPNKSVLYLRGVNNTIITGASASNTSGAWVITGSSVSIDGNLESLLDHETVELGNHPIMGNNSFRAWLWGNASVTDIYNLTMPTTISEVCYINMFRGTNITTAPVLPATTMAVSCYSSMFYGCTSLTTAPSLPATTLAYGCYSNMFSGCSALTTAPSTLPATTLQTYCYQSMFMNCTALTTVPTLPATTAVSYCYHSMFYGCTSLTVVPTLPATSFATYCYHSMFAGCTSLNQLPNIPGTTGSASITLPSNCFQEMFKGCTNIKLSATQTGIYVNVYKYPSGSYSISSRQSTSDKDMFTNTGGTFTGRPSSNTTYYTSNTVV